MTRLLICAGFLLCFGTGCSERRSVAPPETANAAESTGEATPPAAADGTDPPTTP